MTLILELRYRRLAAAAVAAVATAATVAACRSKKLPQGALSWSCCIWHCERSRSLRTIRHRKSGEAAASPNSGPILRLEAVEVEVSPSVLVIFWLKTLPLMETTILIVAVEAVEVEVSPSALIFGLKSPPGMETTILVVAVEAVEVVVSTSPLLHHRYHQHCWL